ncbi:MAG: HAD family phosphatase [Chloroflexota bacterium]
MIKAVIFDIGGVLIRTQDRRSRLAWEMRLGLAEWESEAIVFGGEMGTKAQLGEISTAELWAWVGRRLNLSSEQLTQFRRDFWAGDALDGELVAYIRQLRPHYQTAVISNATDALRRELTTRYPIADAFDVIVCSAEEGVMKPDPDIYWTTLRRLGRQPAETVFIDDNPDNVAAAQALGMAAVQFRPGLGVPAELGKLGMA